MKKNDAANYYHELLSKYRRNHKTDQISGISGSDLRYFELKNKNKRNIIIDYFAR